MDKIHALEKEIVTNIKNIVSMGVSTLITWRLNLLLPRIRSGDTSVLLCLNKVDKKILGDWWENLHGIASVKLLTMALDPASVNTEYHGPFTMKNGKRVKYIPDLEKVGESKNKIRHIPVDISSLEAKISKLEGYAKLHPLSELELNKMNTKLEILNRLKSLLTKYPAQEPEAAVLPDTKDHSSEELKQVVMDIDASTVDTPMTESISAVTPETVMTPTLEVVEDHKPKKVGRAKKVKDQEVVKVKKTRTKLKKV